MEQKYIIIGPRGATSATARALFGAVTRGEIPNACYLYARGGGSLFRRAIGRLYRNSDYTPGLRSELIGLTGLSASEIGACLDPEKQNILIYTPSTRIRWAYRDRAPFQIRRKYPDCRQVFFLIDGVERTAFVNRIGIDEFRRYLERFDLVVTYDAADAQKYGYPLIDSPLWHAGAAAPASAEYDLYFCGRSKSRTALLKQILDRAEPAGIRCSYHITEPAPGDHDLKEIRYSKWVDYETIVKELLASNCLLDINAELNYGLTIRAREAVIYNKKLLTNNPQIRTCPYYDPRWMHVFESADDIDYEWISKVEDIDYGYRGDYTVETFFSSLLSLLNR